MSKVFYTMGLASLLICLSLSVYAGYGIDAIVSTADGRVNTDNPLPCNTKISGITTTNPLTVQQRWQAAANAGYIFGCSSDIDEDLDLGEILVFRIVGDADNIPFRYLVSSVGRCTVQLFVGATTTDSGTAITINCRNRSSSNTTAITVHSQPTVSDFGTILEKFPQGASGNFTTSYNRTMANHQRLGKDDVVLLRITAANDTVICVEFRFIDDTH